MKTIFLHGLGQTAHDWKEVIERTSLYDADCPELFSLSEGEVTYSHILEGLEKRYADTPEPLFICGLSLGAILALDYTIRHNDKVASLILIGVQYKVPSLLIDFQNLLFRCMPSKTFENMGISKKDMIKLSHSMRSLDFSDKLKDVTCPVVILCGEKDNANIKASKMLKELLPQAELHIIPEAGHEINKCAPDAIAGIVNTHHQPYNIRR